jgi:hypothetical protein
MHALTVAAASALPALQELLSRSTFPIPPERLVEMAKDVLRAGEARMWPLLSSLLLLLLLLL